MSEKSCEEIIFVHVRVNYITRLIELTPVEANNVQNIVTKMFAALKISSDTDTVDFSFRDNLGAPILAAQLPALIMQKKSSGSFFIELVFNKAPLSIRAEAIKIFLQTKFPKEMFFEETEFFNGHLTTKKEKLLIDCLYSYITETFSNDPPQNEIVNCCKAIVQLFPYLGTDPSDFHGIDKLYNPKNKKGRLFHKFRNQKNSKYSKQMANDESPISKNELKDRLKYCVVKNEKQELKNLLSQTVSLRRELLKEQGKQTEKTDGEGGDDLKEFWIFYFVDTDLILYDFHILFGHIKSDSLEKKWDIIHDKPLSHFKDQIDLEKIGTTNIKVWQLITTFMSLKQRGDVWKSLQSLIVFSKNPQEEPMKMLTGNQSPYMIAIVAADKKNIKFYIAVYGYLISLSEKHDVIFAMDLVYKLHKIFDIHPHKNVKRLIDFLDYFVYANDTKENCEAIDKQMRDLGDKLLNIIV